MECITELHRDIQSTPDSSNIQGKLKISGWYTGALPGFFKGGSHWVKLKVPTRLSCWPPCCVLGCLLKKGSSKGGHEHPRTPYSYALNLQNRRNFLHSLGKQRRKRGKLEAQNHTWREEHEKNRSFPCVQLGLRAGLAFSSVCLNYAKKLCLFCWLMPLV